MLILGIESSCDETAVAIVKDGRTVLSSVVATQIDEHKLYGGVVPEIASRRHCENIVAVCKEALTKSDIDASQLTAIAVTYAPGLIGALLVGVNFAKGLALSLGVPLVPVHHIKGHIAANYICHEELEPPYLCLVASGGHSHIVEVNSYTDFNTIGRTIDDAAGEAFDKAARAMGFPYPGGISIDNVSKNGDPLKYKLPHPKTQNPLDFSFSGLKTHIINLVHNEEQRANSVDIPSLAASFQHTITDILVEKFMLAVRQKEANTIALAGGVAANSMLRCKLKEKADSMGLKFYVPDLSLCGDNAAMIACQGYYEFLAGHTCGMDLNAIASCKLDAEASIL